ncbi:hypothetical protein [Arthrobacter sp. NPDC056727]|uniref:hypothetical protein n=1 Tax=Arthrobacter sp. NPDC056727 TaxID=3345927 RepID=UPI0036715471
MSYDFHLICDQDPRLGLFDSASEQFENKFRLIPVEASKNLTLGFNGEDLAFIAAPQKVPNSEAQRIFGEQVATQLQGEAWVSEVNCPHEKDIAEAVRAFLTITVTGTKGVLIDPQANEVMNAGWGA